MLLALLLLLSYAWLAQVKTTITACILDMSATEETVPKQEVKDEPTAEDVVKEESGENQDESTCFCMFRLVLIRTFL